MKMVKMKKMNKPKKTEKEITEKREPGAPKQYTDRQLMDIAFDVKHNKLKGARVSFLLLEKETGISRNTFSRRIPDYIKEINNPIGRKVVLHDRDPVYFPSIDELFELYKDKNILRDKLHEFEILFFELYTELEKLKEESSKGNNKKNIVETFKKDLAIARDNAEKYEKLYNQAVVSSTFAEKRKTLNIKENLIKLENKKADLDLTNLNKVLEPFTEGKSEINNEDTKKGLDKFSKFSNLIKRKN